MATCSSCHAPIVWCRTETGARMPVDVDPDPNGIVIKTGATVREPNTGRYEDVVRVLKKAERTLFDPDEPDDGSDHVDLRFNSHFSTCPDSKRHRKPR